MTETIKLRVPTEELARWRAVATSRGLSKMIREVVSEHVSRIEVAAVDPAVKDAPVEQDRVRAGKREQVEGLRKLMQFQAKSIPAPKPAPPNPGRRCPDHPSLLVAAGQTRCRFSGCFQKIA